MSRFFEVPTLGLSLTVKTCSKSVDGLLLKMKVGQSQIKHDKFVFNSLWRIWWIMGGCGIKWQEFSSNCFLSKQIGYLSFHPCISVSWHLNCCSIWVVQYSLKFYFQKFGSLYFEHVDTFGKTMHASLEFNRWNKPCRHQSPLPLRRFASQCYPQLFCLENGVTFLNWVFIKCYQNRMQKFHEMDNLVPSNFWTWIAQATKACQMHSLKNHHHYPTAQKILTIGLKPAAFETE